MTTAITADQYLAALTKWGVPWRFYSNKADFLRHNRNAQQGNGPLRGGVGHNTASTSQTGMLVYLYAGDGPTSSKPGPLCQAAIPKKGDVVLLCWGTATHSGPGDAKVEAKARADAMPLNGELSPQTNGLSASGTTPINPHYIGFEMMHAAEGPTAEQYRNAVLYECAVLDMLGGPALGYSAGSFIMHRELTTNRSDPQGVPRDGKFRRDVAAQLKAGPPKAAGTTTPAPKPEAPVTLKPTTCVLTSSVPALTRGETVTLTAACSPAVAGVVHFEWYDARGDKPVWTRFASVRVDAKGKASVGNRPSQNVTYHALFDADDAAYAVDYAPNVSVAVVDLTRLMTEHKRLLDRVAALEAAPAPQA